MSVSTQPARMRRQSTVSVSPVHGWRERREFFHFPWKLYQNDPSWVPPLRGEQWGLIGYGRHPFYDDAEAQTFLARRGGEVVGRVSAILNHAHNREFPSDPLGFFGFFESIDDQEVADGLLAAVREWFAQRNLHVLRGPANPSLTYEFGVLLEGHDTPPTFMLSHSPLYYDRLIENFGFRKSQDMLAYTGHMRQMPELEGRLGQIADQVAERYDVKIRSMDRANFRADVETFLQMYNSSMVLTWGFVPISPSEMKHMASSLRFLIDPDMALIATVEGKTAGVILCLPDFNPRIKKIDGRLFPFGFLRMLYRKRDIRRVRVIAINVLPEFQRLGVGLVLMKALVPQAIKLGIDEAEFSWVLESNEMARLGLEKGGAKHTKTWRMYDYRPDETER